MFLTDAYSVFWMLCLESLWFLHDNKITFIQLINVCLTTFIQFLSPAHKREPDINFSFKTIDLATADLLFCHSKDWLDIVKLFHSAVIKHKINYAGNLLFLWTKG